MPSDPDTAQDTASPAYGLAIGEVDPGGSGEEHAAILNADDLSDGSLAEDIFCLNPVSLVIEL